MVNKMEILDGKEYRLELLDEYKKEITENNYKIKLAIILINQEEASLTYVKNKIKYCNMVNIQTSMYYMNDKTKEEELINLINKLNLDNSVTGIILQSPVPKQIDFNKCSGLIDPKKDIDGFTKDNLYYLYHNEKCLIPCTCKGVVKLLEHYNIKLEGKHVVLIGRGKMTCKPLSLLMTNKNATVTLCHSKTKDLSKYTREADIVVSAAKHPNLINRDMVKKGFIGVDISINYVDGKLCGDFNFEDVKDKAKYITPVPGGVGPMTIAMIIENLIEAYKLQN